MCSSDLSEIYTDESIVINTLPVDVMLPLCGQVCHLGYRGVALVFVEAKKSAPLGDGVDFIYCDDHEVLFNRVSDQNAFVESDISCSVYETILCCEVTYSEGDSVADLSDEALSAAVQKGLEKTKILDLRDQGDVIVTRLPRVYPMYRVGFREEIGRAHV
mgnify:CR=1 FL=1